MCQYAAHLIQGEIGYGERGYRFIADKRALITAPVIAGIHIVACGLDGAFLYAKFSKEGDHLVHILRILLLAACGIGGLCLNRIYDFRDVRDHGHFFTAVYGNCALRRAVCGKRTCGGNAGGRGGWGCCPGFTCHQGAGAKREQCGGSDG